ncbi:hypothetical protein ACFVQB_00545 [Paenibacillus sp. NPDC057886]|uniref:hypothetical protein n=1 Tax=Paenibacillus sp. NPDC057886 TaxID=3346270 RepID=UPI0036BAE21C
MSTYYLPEQAGTGVYQTMQLGSQAMWSFCDLTPSRDTVVDERNEHTGLVLAFNLSGQQQWRNQNTGRLHTFKENHFQILDGGSFAVSNLYEQGQQAVGNDGMQLHE